MSGTIWAKDALGKGKDSNRQAASKDSAPGAKGGKESSPPPSGKGGGAKGEEGPPDGKDGGKGGKGGGSPAKGKGGGKSPVDRSMYSISF